MPTHCTITCFGFRATRIEGVSVSIHAPTLRGDAYLYFCAERIEVRMTVCVIVFAVGAVRGMTIKGKEKVNPVPEHSLLMSISTKGTARLNVPIREMNCHKQYNLPSQHMYCGRTWNLTQALDAQ